MLSEVHGLEVRVSGFQGSIYAVEVRISGV